jgi:acyl-CoA reductase-like NAD-dependent aldehyde dehydrogenase
MTRALPSHDPATGALVGEVLRTPPEEVPGVVARARAAAPGWAARTLAERLELLERAAPRLEAEVEALTSLVTREMGKPTPDAKGEVIWIAKSFVDTCREIAASLEPEVVTRGSLRSTIHHVPHGVCAAITPWNFPLMMPHWLALPALIAGNTVVLKPSEETPLVAQRYAELIGVDLPEDVLQVIHGEGDTGKALVADDVDLIAFTGSRAAGRDILSSASESLKRVILELGGKDPLIVLADADPEAAAAFAAKNGFRNAGQVCVSTERVYVDRSIAERFEEALAKVASEVQVGPGDQEGVTLGPLVNATQKAHVESQVKTALAEGARLLAGGETREGNFLSATVLSDCTHAMEIMREETFGPVLCVARVDDAEEALRLANDTPYGLGAVVYGGDLAEAEAVAARVEAGMVGVNRACGGVEGTPWVGAKQSGYGFHGGVAGHRQFAIPRVVTTRLPKE